jgi:CHAT domain-containing protein
MKNNPIYKLAKQVNAKKRTLKQAEREVFSKQIKDRNLLELTEAIIELLEKDILLAFFLSILRIKYWEAQIKSRDLNWVHWSFIHGEVLRILGELKGAFHRFSDCRSFYIEKAMNPTLVAGCEINMGIICAELGDSKEALNLFESARVVLEKREITPDLATCYINMGCAHSQLGEHKKSLESLQSARSLCERLGDDIGLAKADLNTGNVWRELGQITKALPLMRSARRIYEQKGNDAGIAKTDLNIGHCYFDAGDFDKALKCYLFAKRIYDRRGIAAEIANANLHIGTVYRELGDSSKALELFQPAKQIYEEQGSELGRAKVNRNIAVAYAYLGAFDMALELLQSARAVYERLGNERGRAGCNLTIGMVHSEGGQFRKATEAYQSARRTYEMLGDEIGLAHCNLGMGNIHCEFGEYKTSLLLYQLAKEGYQKQFCETSLADCDLNMGLLHVYLRNHAQAHDLLHSAEMIYQQRGFGRQLAKCNLNLSNLYWAQGDFEKALDLTNSAKRSFVEFGMKQEIARCDLNIAACEARLGNHEQALDLLQGLSSDCKDIFPIYWRYLYVTGICWWAKNDLGGALVFLVNAVDLIEKLRGWLPNQDIRGTFLGEVRLVYCALIAILLDTGEYAIALQYVERLKSRRLSEMLAGRDLLPRQAAEEQTRIYRTLRSEMMSLAHRLRKEQDPIRATALMAEYDETERSYNDILKSLQVDNPEFDPDHTSHIEFRDISPLLPDEKSAIIELFPMEDKTVVFVVTKNREIADSTVVVQDYTVQTLLDQVERLSEITNDTEWDDYLDQVLEEQYTTIFQTIKPYLDGIDKITFIPHSGFHLLPLHAMFIEKDRARRLIDKCVVSYAPSAKILKQCIERERPNPEKVLVAATEPVWNPLPSVPQEVDFIKLAWNADVLDCSTRHKILSSAKDCHIFHYTGHASEEGLELHNPEDLSKPEVYDLPDIFVTLDLPEADLAVLSACETGKTKLGKLGLLDEYIGVASGFLHAGARTVIASLWEVDDVSTFLLMKRFYENLKKSEGISKSEALRDAQLWLKGLSPHEAIITRGLRRPFSPSSPRYWAGFCCIGA